ncbi:glutamate receptor ionotropic, kainate glr-3-like [Daphnia carinata]|uniref:glutamate receptor ionotropic, kainate glr-3-like n=1 Tax=Daphnia carinata TaxID=120202 RepID=UPI002868C7AA|nr:glutamate receptor ionotropic, kainate glr-3-like [Daphnia carinata]
MSSVLSSIKPFQPMVWLMILICLLLAAICFAASSPSNDDRFFSYKRLMFSRIGNYVFYTVAILTNQGSVFAFLKFQSKLPFRLTAGVWCLFAFVMVNVYCSTLTSHITARKMSTPPDGSIQVVEEGVLSYLVIDDSFGRELILGATSGPLKKMGDIFRRHPENFIPDNETGFRKVASGCCAFNDFVNYFNYRIGKDFQETGKCRVHIGKPIKGYGFNGLLIKKDNNYRDVINQGLLDLHQTGLVDYWRQKQAGRGSPVCQAQSKKKSKVLRSLNLRQDLVTAFFILGIGISISFIVFLAEQCRRCNRKRQ